MIKKSEIIADNPLIWPVLSIIKSTSQSCQIHHLASKLQFQGYLSDLDCDETKALFKRNFLLMNALYQLQELLLPDTWLQVQAMDIRLFNQLSLDHKLLYDQDLALRSYYLDWSNFETSAEEITSLFDNFWSRYNAHFTQEKTKIDKANALLVFELDSNASLQDIRRQWRKLALKWHPDRSSGDSIKFRQVCDAWRRLREYRN